MNNTEIEQINSEITYQELGHVPEYGKHRNIETLNSLGFNVPPTLVFSTDITKGEQKYLDNWRNYYSNEGEEIILRTVNREERNAPGIRDNVENQEIETNVKTRVTLLQALPQNSINTDIISANIFVSKDLFTLKPQATAEIAPDTATLLNRISLSPYFQLSLKENGLIQTPVKENREKLWEHVLYRVGRLYSKELGEEYPPIDLDIHPNDFQKLVKRGQEAIVNNPEKYPAPAYWLAKIEREGIGNLQLSDNIISVLKPEIKHCLRASRKIPRKNIIFKMSLLTNPNNDLTPIYWDIIMDRNDIIRYES